MLGGGRGDHLLPRCYGSEEVPPKRAKAKVVLSSGVLPRLLQKEGRPREMMRAHQWARSPRSLLNWLLLFREAAQPSPSHWTPGSPSILTSSRAFPPWNPLDGHSVASFPTGQAQEDRWCVSCSGRISSTWGSRWQVGGRL